MVNYGILVDNVVLKQIFPNLFTLASDFIVQSQLFPQTTLEKSNIIYLLREV